MSEAGLTADKTQLSLEKDCEREQVFPTVVLGTRIERKHSGVIRLPLFFVISVGQ